MYKWTARKREIKCAICTKIEIATSNNQRYCESCRSLVNRGHVNAFNESRRQNTYKTCIECQNSVKELGMKKRCRECLNRKKELNSLAKVCNKCKKVEIPTGKVYCTKCKRTTQLENMKKSYAVNKPKRFCRGCKCPIEHIPPAQRYCSDECRIRKPKKEKEAVKPKKIPTLSNQKCGRIVRKAEDIVINPFFLQKRGSKG